MLSSSELTRPQRVDDSGSDIMIVVPALTSGLTVSEDGREASFQNCHSRHLLLPPVESLFTPVSSPASSPAPSSQERVNLSHVEVPSFPQGLKKSDYQRIPKAPDARSPGKVYRSLQDALQASIQHNAGIGSLDEVVNTQHSLRHGTAAVSSPSFPRALADNYKRKHQRDNGREVNYRMKKAKLARSSPGPIVHGNTGRTDVLPIYVPSDNEDEAVGNASPVMASKFRENSGIMGEQVVIQSVRNGPETDISVLPKEQRATRLELVHMRRDMDMTVLSANLRFLRQSVSTASHLNTKKTTPSAEPCVDRVPHWHSSFSAVCESLVGVEEKDISTGGPLELFDSEMYSDDEADIMSSCDPQSQNHYMEESWERGSTSSIVNVQQQLFPLSSSVSSTKTYPPPERRTGKNTLESCFSDDQINALETDSLKDNSSKDGLQSKAEKARPNRASPHKSSVKVLGKQRATGPVINNACSTSPHLTVPVHCSSPRLPFSRLPVTSDVIQDYSSVDLGLENVLATEDSPFLTQSVAPTSDHLHLDSRLESLVDSSYGSSANSDDFPLDDTPYGSGPSSIPPSSHVNGYYEYPDNVVATDSWAELSPFSDCAVFGDGTIDPSLLGGESLQMVNGTIGSTLEPIPSPWLEPSRTPDLFSDTSAASSRQSRHPRKPALNHSEKQVSLSLPSYSPNSQRPRREHRATRIPNDMVSSADLDLTSNSESEKDSVAAARAVQRKKKTQVGTSLQPLSAPSEILKFGKTRRGIDWPKVNDWGYCHQCRSKSKIVKVFCACDRKFCVRCLYTRYDGKKVYDPDSASFVCPVCKGICTCDKCTPLRGEVYIPLRGRAGNQQSPLFQQSHKRSFVSRVAPSSRPRLGAKTNLPIAVHGKPAKYFSTVHDTTGVRIGNAYTGVNNHSEHFVVVKSSKKGVSQPVKKKVVGGTAQKPRRRVFVGSIDASWGFSDRVFTSDLEPIPWSDRNNGPHERTYVGDKAPLYKSFVTDLASSDGWKYQNGEKVSPALSALTSLAELEPDAGTSFLETFDIPEELQDFAAFLKGPEKRPPADSLKEADLRRAITMGLKACGLKVQSVRTQIL